MNTENKRNTKNKVDLDMLFRSFNNVTTSDEERDICDWLNGNEENKKVYSTARDIHEAFLLEAPAELLEAHSPESARKRKKSLRIALQCIGYAAAIAIFCVIGYNWKSHATLTLLAKQDLPTFGYNMIDPLKSWCWGSILFYPFKISRFS